jgi:Ca2+-binding EF-hand superfamily protein
VSLSAGDHIITLMATDSKGVSGSDTVSIKVFDLVYGDTNGNGQFTGDDIYSVIDWVIGRQPMPQAGTPAFVAVDVDGDGSITAHDVRLMIDRLSGALDKFPVEP